MLTLVDAIRLITHALKSLIRRGYVDFSDFQKEKELMAGKMISSISELSREQLGVMIEKLKDKKINELIIEISQV